MVINEAKVPIPANIGKLQPKQDIPEVITVVKGKLKLAFWLLHKLSIKYKAIRNGAIVSVINFKISEVKI